MLFRFNVYWLVINVCVWAQVELWLYTDEKWISSWVIFFYNSDKYLNYWYDLAYIFVIKGDSNKISMSFFLCLADDVNRLLVLHNRDLTVVEFVAWFSLDFDDIDTTSKQVEINKAWKVKDVLDRTLLPKGKSQAKLVSSSSVLTFNSLIVWSLYAHSTN